jgi:UMF1 family MFS transporter
LDSLKKFLKTISFGLFDTGETILSALIFSLAFPIYISQHIDIKIFSFIYGSVFIISFIFSLYIGKYADEKGNRKNLFILFSLLTFLSAFFIFFTYENYLLALVLFLLSALFHQQAFVFYNSLLLNFDNKGFASGLGISFGYIGSALALIFFADRLQIPNIFLIASLIFLIFSLPSFIFLENPSIIKKDGINLKYIFKDKRFLLIIISILMLTEVANTIISMMGVYLKAEFQLREEEIYKIIGFSAIGGVLGGIFWGVLTEKFNINKIFPLAFPLWITIIIIGFIINKTFLIPLGILIGFSLSHLWATSRVFLIENFPKEEISIRLSFLSLSERIATSIGLFFWGFALFFTQNDYRLSFLLMIIFPFTGLIIFLKGFKSR